MKAGRTSWRPSSLPKDEVDTIQGTKARRRLEEDLANVNLIIWVLNAISIVVLALAL